MFNVTLNVQYSYALLNVMLLLCHSFFVQRTPIVTAFSGLDQCKYSSTSNLVSGNNLSGIPLENAIQNG